MRKPKKRRNYIKLAIKIVLVLSVFHVLFTFYDQHKEMKYLKARKKVLSEDINKVEKDIQSLEDQIENSNTDEHIERIAREHLKMVKEDELIFIDSAPRSE
ncbi:MAG TPA: septum formation initiator family protein [Oscillospiraceae bacterium]|nr:septum formation initiator family protein [Oscillospiraceae bacterium]